MAPKSHQPVAQLRLHDGEVVMRHLIYELELVLAGEGLVTVDTYNRALQRAREYAIRRRHDTPRRPG